MALIARNWAQAGALRGGGLVATVMSNLGLERFLGGLGLALHRTAVGDRYVVEAMRARGFKVGGEQSGDRKSGGEGKRGSVRVDLGGWRCIQKKQKKRYN